MIKGMCVNTCTVVIEYIQYYYTQKNYNIHLFPMNNNNNNSPITNKHCVPGCEGHRTFFRYITGHGKAQPQPVVYSRPLSWIRTPPLTLPLLHLSLSLPLSYSLTTLPTPPFYMPVPLQTMMWYEILVSISKYWYGCKLITWYLNQLVKFNANET